MRPPKVSRALLDTALRQRIPRREASVSKSERAGSLVASAARHPLGILPDALPALWLSKARDGALWIMQESPSGPVCLATIAPEVVAQLVASKGPQPLEVK